MQFYSFPAQSESNPHVGGQGDSSLPPTSFASMMPISTPAVDQLSSSLDTQYMSWTNSMGYGFGDPTIQAPAPETSSFQEQPLEQPNLVPELAQYAGDRWKNDPNGGFPTSLDYPATPLMGRLSPDVRQGRTLLPTPAPDMSEPATSAVQPDIIMTNDKGDSSPLSEPSPPSSPIEKQSRSRGRSGPRGRRHKAKSSTGGQLPTIWEPGLKEIKVTEDMTFAERKHADEWNTAFARVKADHTREQNRKSAQKSRQKKVELLDRTREERDRFQQKNMHMNHQLGVLEERVSKLASENQHLRSQHENSRNRIILLEAQLQQQVQLGRKMSQALPQMGAQAQTQAQVQAQAQPQLGQNNMASRSRTPSQPQGQGAPRQSQSQAQPQGGSGSGYMLGGTNTTQFLGGNMATPGPSTSQQQQQQPQQQPTPISPDEDHINWFSLTNLCDMGSGNQS